MEDSSLSNNTRSRQVVARELSATLNEVQLRLLAELLTMESAPVRKKNTGIPNPLPVDWRPNEKHYAWAKERRCSAQWVDVEAQKLRDWAIRKDVRKVNWDQVLYTFMMKDAPATAISNGAPVARRIYA